MTKEEFYSRALSFDEVGEQVDIFKKEKIKYEQEIERLHSIIKEVREYINNHQLVFELSSKKQIAYWFDMFYKELLEILDKEK